MTSNNTKVEQLIRELQNTWLAGDVPAISKFYHQDVVLLPPGASQTITGREAVVETYRQFLNSASVNRFRITTINTSLYGDTAITMFGFEIDYEIEDQVYNETGNEILVLMKESDSWKIVWRTQIPQDNT